MDGDGGGTDGGAVTGGIAGSSVPREAGADADGNSVAHRTQPRGTDRGPSIRSVLFSVLVFLGAIAGLFVLIAVVLQMV